MRGSSRIASDLGDIDICAQPFCLGIPPAVVLVVVATLVGVALTDTKIVVRGWLSVATLVVEVVVWDLATLVVGVVVWGLATLGAGRRGSCWLVLWGRRRISHV